MPALFTSPTTSATRSQVRSGSVAAGVLVALALAVGGCSSSSSSQPQAGSTSSVTSSSGPRPVASKVLLGRVAGNLHQPNKRVFDKHRKRLLRRVGQAVDSWIDGGFVGVAYPRKSFPAAFTAFTGPARHDAGQQQRLLTNWTLRKRIDGVDVKKRRVVVDVLAPHGRPAGVTARVLLVFTTTGGPDQRVRVRGRLFLAPDGKGAWRIFGYDVSQGGTR